MKRKGFTLVELLIVIGVIGILSSMAMMGGSEATNIANANKIIDEFKIISAAMNLYYADNRQAIDGFKVSNANSDVRKTILTGLVNYMKNTDSIVIDEATQGKYYFSIEGEEWWLTYQLAVKNSKVAKILANKAKQEGLKANTTAKDTTNNTNKLASDYAGDTTVCYQVR